MPIDAKKLRRLRALIRVAQEGSGAELPERESASLEVVRLLVEGRPSIDGAELFEEDIPEKRRESPKRGTRPPPPRAQPAQEENYPQFQTCVLGVVVRCRHCDQLIRAGDRVWRRVDDTMDPLYFVHPYPCIVAD